ncbi:MAG: hypothetical protein KF718_31220 [Polyangiaceae bacterium]|nr:hypothetical protein [Polyangiaceae bacterium]
MTDSRETDWTGVSPDRGPIAPLTSATFVERLANLTAAATGLATMQAAMVAQYPEDAPGLPEAPRTPR